MSSWVGLFAAVWFARDAHLIEETGRRKHDQRHQQSAGVPPPERTSWKRWASRDKTARVCTVPSTGRGAEAHSYAGVAAGPVGMDRVDGAADARESGWERVDLGRRSAPYRLQLERTLAEAIRARARLKDGSYGECTVCSAPISLTLLNEKPWSSTCPPCALDI